MVLPWNAYGQKLICFLAQVETTWWQIAEHSSKFDAINEEKEMLYQHEDTACKAQLHCLTKDVLLSLGYHILPDPGLQLQKDRGLMYPI